MSDSPRRGACAFTTPISRSPAKTAAPDIPDHTERSSVTRARGVAVTCSDSRCSSWRDSGGTTPRTCSAMRSPRSRAVSAKVGYPIAQHFSTNSAPVVTSRLMMAALTTGRSSASGTSSSARSNDSGSPMSALSRVAACSSMSGVRIVTATASATTWAAVRT